ncbi:archaemetzincin [Paracrocinitomix mangrovi]|uniref:archaemetzincin n=1 Tax=Paracrocinitomix mangrovi TaxID=2862509 RepID=UPI001C8E8E5B|nr:archaemetzincin [Paracrocinitomix mangrovi]UKN03150.1 archaemetzincin [Paracrocinitomix mangrovi]
MKKKFTLPLTLSILMFGIGCTVGYVVHPDKEMSRKTVKSTDEIANDEHISRELRFLESSLDTIHKIKANPIPGEWLYHNKEVQQSSQEFLHDFPDLISEKRDKIYLQPIGAMSPKQEEILKITADYLSVFYNATVQIEDSLSADVVPKSARRFDDFFERDQFKTTYILDEVLKPNIPKDARAYVGFTSYDLYPNDNYNFVFGQGRIGGKVGIYSLARLGYPDFDSTQYKICLKRTLKLASHELGHIFGMTHCVQYECIMNGSNTLEESDSKPFYLCPIDLLKVCQAGSIDEIYRFQKLGEFWEKHGFKENKAFYDLSIKLLQENLFRREGSLVY